MAIKKITKAVDENETKVTLEGSIVVPEPEVDEFKYRLDKLIDEFAI